MGREGTMKGQIGKRKFTAFQSVEGSHLRLVTLLAARPQETGVKIK